MNKTNASTAIHTAQPVRRKLSRDTVSLVGDLLPLCDFIGVLLAAYLATLAYANWFSPAAATLGMWDNIARAALVAAVLAPLILCDRAFVSFANGGQTTALIRCYAVRFVMFAGVVGTIGLASRFLENLPSAWLGLWLASALLVTALTRGLLVGSLRRLERSGILTETVAVVGAGPAARRLIRHLQQTRGDSVEILGVFDDQGSHDNGGIDTPTGSIADLLTLGQTHPIDWILLTPPVSDEGRQRAIVHRLKALAAPIGLCPPHIGIEPAIPPVADVGAGRSVATLPVERRHSIWDSILTATETVLPRWVITVLGLPLTVPRQLHAAHAAYTPQALPQRQKLALSLDNYGLEQFTEVAARFGQQRFGYVVTPNADHLIRLHCEPTFRALYAEAAYVLLDSRFIAKLLQITRKLQLPVCTGSDLTAKLLAEVISHDDRLVMIGGSDEQAACLSKRYGLRHLAHFNPPMGFIRDPAAVETCLQFIESHSPFRYCLLAVGAPQQETIAQLLKTRGIARGMALCIGASVNFLTGDEQRAPLWMQRCGMEWLFRLLQAPGRMAGRYLVRGPRIFGLLRHTEIELRAAHDEPRSMATAIPIPQWPATASSTRLLVMPSPGTGRIEPEHARPGHYAP